MINPLHAIIVLEMDEPEETKNGIFIPSFARDELETGTVVAAGAGETLSDGTYKENPVKKGDRVLLAKGSGRKIKLDNREYLFVTPAEVTGILRDEV